MGHLLNTATQTDERWKTTIVSQNKRKIEWIEHEKKNNMLIFHFRNARSQIQAEHIQP